jgi:class 3 adenylate cyclase
MAAETRNLTILLTDIKGFTDKTSHQSRADMMSMLDTHNKIVLPVLQSKGGRLIKTIGDAFLMTYDSPTDAVLAGIAVQEALTEHNKDKEKNDRIEVRVAINSGEVTLADNDVFGEPVNITARIEGVADAGEVFFTEAVYLAMNKNEVPSSEVGLLQLKGIPEKIRVYKVRRENPVEGMPEAKPAPRKLWSRLKGSVAPPPASAKAAMAGPHPPLYRRAAALAIDLLIVGFFVTMISGSEARVDARYDKARGPDVTMTKNGVKVNSKDSQIVIDENGVDITDKTGGRRRSNHWKFPLVWALYNFILLRRLGGATVGKKILKLKVAALDGSPLEKHQSLWRAGVSVLSLYILGCGYLWALLEHDRRTWHDLVAGTIVVNA